MAWDIATPGGSEAANTTDDYFRATKSLIQQALRADTTEGDEAIFPGSDTANPVYRYRGLRGSTGSRPTAGQYGLYMDTTRNALQRDNGASWDDVATVIPAGTVMLFYQASAPVGWTQVVTQNDKALRVVSTAGGGSGGTHPLSTPPSTSHTHTNPTYTLLAANLPPVTVTVVSQTPGSGALRGITDDNYTASNDRAQTYSSPTNITAAATGFNIGDTGSNGPTAFSPAYIDVIIASKD